MTESGGTSKWEMTYNMDSELEKMQTLTTFNGVEYNTIWDFKMVNFGFFICLIVCWENAEFSQFI